MGRISSLAKDMIQLHKGAEKSPFLHEVDALDWIRLGWSRAPQPIATKPAQSPQPEATITEATITRESRESDLMDMSWQAIKKIAESHGIEKPEDGWDEAVPMILDAEYPKD